MKFRRRHKGVPELNTTSTADISFMLLVFFLVTSSMNSDQGLGRKLAPMDDEKQEQQDIQRSNVLEVRIDAHDVVYCDGNKVTAKELRRQVASFVASRQTGRYIIAVETDRHASYDAYFEMQNAIAAAYHQLRETMAQREYGCPFSQCTREQHDVIVARYPQRISEGMAEEKGGEQ